MKVDYGRRYDSSADFFVLGGSVVMQLSVVASIAVCEQAAARGLVVARIESGIWHSPGFEARLDCIWDGADPPVSLKEAEINNIAAADFIRAECVANDVFIITAPNIIGWRY